MTAHLFHILKITLVIMINYVCSFPMAGSSSTTCMLDRGNVLKNKTMNTDVSAKIRIHDKSGSRFLKSQKLQSKNIKTL